MKALKQHYLNCQMYYFWLIWDGLKTCELRLNDRNFLTGDIVILRELDDNGIDFTGREIKFIISNVLSEFDGLEMNYVILSFKKIRQKNI